MGFINDISKELKRLKKEKKDARRKEEIEIIKLEVIPQAMEVVRVTIGVDLKVDTELTPNETNDSWTFKIREYEVVVTRDEVLSRWDELDQDDEDEDSDLPPIDIIGGLIVEKLRSINSHA